MSAPVARIILRYLSAALVSAGFLSPDMGKMVAADSDLLAVLAVIVGVAGGLVAELWYRTARKYGGET